MTKIGKDGVFIVAELGARNGSLLDTLSLVREAGHMGCNAVKTQCYSADTICIKSNHPLLNLVKGTWRDFHLYDLYAEAATPYDWQLPIKKLTEELGMTFISTPFSEYDADFLEGLGLEIFKVASFELIDLPLIEYIAQKGKPIVLSTGMGSWAEIEMARQRIANALGLDCEDTEFLDNVFLLHCVSGYPADETEMDMGRLIELGQYGHSVGLSDHSRSSISGIMSVALGGALIEKHIAIDRSGPDSAFALLPNEFSDFVKDIRCAEKMMRPSSKPSEDAQKGMRPSIWVTRNIGVGEAFTKENIATLRPFGGLPPREFEWVLKKRASRDIKAGNPLLEEHIQA